MQSSNRIPGFDEKSFDGMLFWFAEMSKRDLLFHPDDSPDSIVDTKTNAHFFTRDECRILEDIIDQMFDEYGDDVYEAAYPVFMKRMNLPLDA